MRMAAPTAALLLSCALVGAQPSAGAQPPAAAPSTETLQYAIMRKGEQIGTHRVEFRRAGKETSVNLATNVEVKVLFVTAYRFQHTATERWVNGRLVALDAETDDNGKQHRVSVALKGTALQIDADGKASQADKNIIPGSLWNPDLLRQSVMLDPQTGQVMPISVVDEGTEQVTTESGPATAHRYTIKGKFEQDVWYDSRGRLVQSQFSGPDGSVISYRLM